MADTAWSTMTLAEAGFAPKLDDDFEAARQAGILPNVHGVVAAGGGRQRRLRPFLYQRVA